MQTKIDYADIGNLRMDAGNHFKKRKGFKFLITTCFKKLLTLFIVLLATISAGNAQTTEKVTWNYPVRYGTPEWDALKTYGEKNNAYNIPYEILKTISTEELVKTCLAYPEWVLIHVYNSRLTGLAVIFDNFNGFRELLNRDDATTELMKQYDKLDPLEVSQDWTLVQQGQHAFQFIKIEMLLNVPVMIEKLDNDGMRNLKAIAVSKYQKKRMLPEIYSLWSLSSTVSVCVNIIEKENAGAIENRRVEINSFRRNLVSADILFLDSIVELLK